MITRTGRLTFTLLMAILILFPLQLMTDVLGISARYLAALFQDVGGLSFANPLKLNDFKLAC